jgi:transcriptional regulator with XRE-family HTH domain
MAHDARPAPAEGGARRRGRRGPQDVDLEVARRIRRRRLELGLTQQEVAELLGVIYQQLHKYELGISRVSAGRLHRIAQALGVEVGYLFADVDLDGLGWPEPGEAGRGQRRMLLELVRHVAGIRDRGHREALCRLARELAALEASVPTDPRVEKPRPPSKPQCGLIR